MKKTATICVKVSPEMHKQARAIIGSLIAETPSRFFRAVLDDLIRKDKAGETIAEPVSLLTARQRKRLEKP